MLDESAVIKKYVRSINFLRNLAPARTENSSTIPSQDLQDVADSDGASTSISYQTNVTNDNDRVDSLRSCDSVLKIFTFEPTTFNKNNEKCVEFWKLIDQREDIKPVNCMIMDANSNLRESECQTEQKESEASLWARALYELRKRKLDEVALTTTLEKCKLCKTINCHHIIGYNQNDLLDDTDLTELDNWSPRTANKTTQLKSLNDGKDCGTNPPTEKSLLRLKPKPSSIDEFVSEVEGDISTPECEEEEQQKSDDLININYKLLDSQSSIKNSQMDSDTNSKTNASTGASNKESPVSIRTPSSTAKSTSVIIKTDRRSSESPRLLHEQSRKRVSILDVKAKKGGRKSSLDKESIKQGTTSGSTKANVGSSKILQETKQSLDNLPSSKQISFIDVKEPIIQKQPSKQNDVSNSSLQQVSVERSATPNASERNIADPSIISDFLETENVEEMHSPQKKNGSATDNLRIGSQSQEKQNYEGQFKRSKVEFEQDKYMEKQTSVQNLRSLLNVDTIKQLEMMSKRKSELEEQLTEKLFSSHEDTDRKSNKVYTCSCLETFNKVVCDECSCKEGICTKPNKQEVEKMEKAFSYMPDSDKREMKCFLKILCQIKEVMEQKLDTAVMDAKIVHILTGLQPCECEGGPCDCQIHHLDVGAMHDNQDYMAALLLQKVDKVLDKRFEANIREVIKKKPVVKNIATQMDKKSSDPLRKTILKTKCNVCKFKNCKCVQK